MVRPGFKIAHVSCSHCRKFKVSRVFFLGRPDLKLHTSFNLITENSKLAESAPEMEKNCPIYKNIKGNKRIPKMIPHTSLILMLEISKGD